MVAGAGNAAYLGTAATYLNDVATSTNRGRVLGMNHAALLCGVSLGPVLGGFAAEYSLRAPFVAVAALGVVSAAHACLALSETKPETTAEAAAWAGGGRNLLLALVASSVFDYSPAELGKLFGAMALCDRAFVGPAAVLADRAKDARSIVVPSLLGSALAVAGVAGVVALGAEYHAHFLAAVGLWSLSTAALGPTLPSYAAALVDPAARGVGIAAFRSAGDVGRRHAAAAGGVFGGARRARGAPGARGRDRARRGDIRRRVDARRRELARCRRSAPRTTRAHTRPMFSDAPITGPYAPSCGSRAADGAARGVIIGVAWTAAFGEDVAMVVAADKAPVPAAAPASSGAATTF
ncbi:transporter [Aureococcus anophagefferens]|nr:transporter [Aureococcus anophagefferens]